MANSIQLEVYTIQVRKKYDKESLGFYNTFEDRTDTMYGFFQDFIRYNDKLSVDESHKRSFQIISESMSIEKEDGIFSGIIESGDYGTTSTIVDRVSKKTKYNKSKDDLDIKPFYFLMWFPKTGRNGFLILQRIGIYGINSIFAQRFSNFISSKNEELKIDYNTFLSKEMTKKTFEKGKVKEIILRRSDLPADVVDKLVGHDSKIYWPDVKAVEIKLKAKDSFFGGMAYNNFIENENAKFFESPALETLGMDGGHREQIKVRIGDRNRTIDLTENFALRPYFDIENELDLDHKTGHPVFESIDSIAKQFVQDIQDEVF